MLIVPARTCFREHARNYKLIDTMMPFKERNKLIDTMILAWSDTCMATYTPKDRKQSIIAIKCDVLISILPKTSPYMIARRARFDTETYCWICEDCYHKRYPKPTSVGWTTKLPKPKIQSAKEIYETTGKRYDDDKKGKHKLAEIFDQSKANFNLTKELPSGNNRGWVKYRCPHCDFYQCARAYQGYPEHICKGGWK